MTSVVVKHVGGMQFAGDNLSGHRVMMDASAEAGGLNQGVRPMEMLLLGLGGCTGIDVASMLEKMRVSFDRFEMAIQGERQEEHPQVYRHIDIRYQFWGDDIDAARVMRAVRLSQDKYCSVSAILAQSAEVEAQVYINDTLQSAPHDNPSQNRPV